MVALVWEVAVGWEAEAVQCGSQEETAVKERKPPWHKSGAGGQEAQGDRGRADEGEGR